MAVAYFWLENGIPCAGSKKQKIGMRLRLEHENESP